MSNIEVERRAILSPEQRSAMLDYMHTLGDVKESHRVMIDFSGENRMRTVAIRLDDGRQLLVAKTGGLADTVRRETKIETTADTPLAQTLSYLAILGYQKGMLSLRHKFDVKTPDLKYSIRDVLTHDTLEPVSTLLDIEARHVTPGSEDFAKQKVLDAFAARNLTPLSELEWTEWVKKIYEEVDRPFENTPESAQALTESLAGFTA